MLLQAVGVVSGRRVGDGGELRDAAFHHLPPDFVVEDVLFLVEGHGLVGHEENRLVELFFGNLGNAQDADFRVGGVKDRPEGLFPAALGEGLEGAFQGAAEFGVFHPLGRVRELGALDETVTAVRGLADPDEPEGVLAALEADHGGSLHGNGPHRPPGGLWHLPGRRRVRLLYRLRRLLAADDPQQFFGRRDFFL